MFANQQTLAVGGTPQGHQHGFPTPRPMNSNGRSRPLATKIQRQACETGGNTTYEIISNWSLKGADFGCFFVVFRTYLRFKKQNDRRSKSSTTALEMPKRTNSPKGIPNKHTGMRQIMTNFMQVHANSSTVTPLLGSCYTHLFGGINVISTSLRPKACQPSLQSLRSINGLIFATTNQWRTFMYITVEWYYTWHGQIS